VIFIFAPSVLNVKPIVSDPRELEYSTQPPLREISF